MLFRSAVTPEVLGVVLSAFGGLVAAVAGLIKGMVSDKLNDIKAGMTELKSAQFALKASQDDIRDDIHQMDLRLVKLEVEHNLGDK